MNQSPEVGAQAEHTLTQYQRGLRSAAPLGELSASLDSPVPRPSKRWLAKVISVWSVAALLVAAVSAWFLDQVMAAWIVALVTAIVLSVTLTRVGRANRVAVP